MIEQLNAKPGMIAVRVREHVSRELFANPPVPIFTCH